MDVPTVAESQLQRPSGSCLAHWGTDDTLTGQKKKPTPPIVLGTPPIISTIVNF